MTCTSLTDISQFPDNTNVLFTNVFDNQIDFAHVDNMGLSKIWFTATPPPAPTITSVGFAAGANLTSLNETGQVRLFYLNGSDLSTYETDRFGPLRLALGFANASIEQFGIGDTIRNATELANISNTYASFFTSEAAKKLITVTNDNSFAGSTLVGLAVGTTQNDELEAMHFSAVNNQDNSATADTNLHRDTATNVYMAGPANLVLRPLVDWTPAQILPLLTNTPPDPPVPALTLLTSMFYLSVSELEMWQSTPTVHLDLVATMSDASLITIGTVTLVPNPQPCPLPPPGSAANELIKSRQTMVCPLPWPTLDIPREQTWPLMWSDRGFNRQVVSGATGAGSLMEQSTANTVDYSLQEPFAPEIEFGPASSIASTYQLVRPEPTRGINRNILHRCRRRRRNLAKGPCRYTPSTQPLSLELYLPPVSTYDNLLQIICNELEVDRTAGSQSSQLLAVVPFDYTQLASGFYQISIEVNSFVWRRLADQRLRTLTFGIFNGLGEPHPALAGNNFVTTLQIRFQ